MANSRSGKPTFIFKLKIGSIWQLSCLSQNKLKFSWRKTQHKDQDWSRKQFCCILYNICDTFITLVEAEGEGRAAIKSWARSEMKCFNQNVNKKTPNPMTQQHWAGPEEVGSGRSGVADFRPHRRKMKMAEGRWGRLERGRALWVLWVWFWVSAWLHTRRFFLAWKVGWIGTNFYFGCFFWGGGDPK